jgi:hypothetical protein
MAVGVHINELQEPGVIRAQIHVYEHNTMNSFIHRPTFVESQIQFSSIIHKSVLSHVISEYFANTERQIF